MEQIRYFALILVTVFGVACGNGQTGKNVTDVSPVETNAAVASTRTNFIDVRTVEEFSSGHAVTAKNIPLDVLPSRLSEFNKDEPIYLICQTGNRSAKAASILEKAGFTKIFNVSGGTSAWKSAGLPIEK